MLRDQFIRIPAIPTTLTRGDDATAQSSPGVNGSAVTAASQPASRSFLVDYRVTQGDSLGSIARRFGISTQTLIWSNNLSDADLIQPGDTLVVPPVDGVVHRVASGETLGAIAARYSVDTSAITGYAPNGIANADAIKIGQRLVVPGGTVPEPVRTVPANRATVREPAQAPATAAPAQQAQAAAQPQAQAAAAPASNTGAQVVAGSGFVWPTRGPIFTYFSSWHPGIDISPPFGTPLYATQGGRVIRVLQTNYGYGWYMDIDHGNGYMSRYAHLSNFAVGLGSVVQQGQLIGHVGSTGNSTGPHVHFEVYRNGVPVNPLSLLQ